MTKKEMFAHIATVNAADAEIVAFCEKEIARFDARKSTGNAKAKAETEVRAEKVYNALAEMNNPVTITELLKLTSDEEVAGYTNQRVSALMRKLGERVIIEKVKGKTYFTVA